jgi:hypothetical protein
MRRSLLRTLAPAALIALFLVAGSATAVVAPSYGRQTFTADGSRIDCQDGDCPVPLVVPWSVAFADQGSYDVVITATVSYRTSVGTRAAFGAFLTEDGQSTNLVGALSNRRLAPSPKWTTATVSWLAEGLSGATTYDLVVGLAPMPLAHGSSFAQSAAVLVNVEAAPSTVA